MVRLAAALSCALAVAVPATAFAQDEAHGVREFTQSGTWDVPAGVSGITIELWRRWCRSRSNPRPAVAPHSS